MRILVTGGTGSLGYALTRDLVDRTEHEVVIFSRDEFKQSWMREHFPDPRVDFILGDVRDRERVADACWGVDAIVHAAALKRIDWVARHPHEVYKTNVEGTWNVLGACRGRRVILISSDKACYPINAYGASKMMAEHLTVRSGQTVVRYGNVLGSRGSVLPRWLECKAQGRPLPLTDPYMTRFLITFPQAVALVQFALTREPAGEILVPILPACTMGSLADVIGGPIARVRIRPGGEKEYETLLTEEESHRSHVDGLVTVVRGETPSGCPGTWCLHRAPRERTSANARRLLPPDLQSLVARVVEEMPKWNPMWTHSSPASSSMATTLHSATTPVLRSVSPGPSTMPSPSGAANA